MPARKRRKGERQRVTFSFLPSPYTSASPLRLMGISFHSSDTEHRAEWSTSKLSHDTEEQPKAEKITPETKEEGRKKALECKHWDTC